TNSSHKPPLGPITLLALLALREKILIMEADRHGFGWSTLPASTYVVSVDGHHLRHQVVPQPAGLATDPPHLQAVAYAAAARAPPPGRRPRGGPARRGPRGGGRRAGRVFHPRPGPGPPPSPPPPAVPPPLARALAPAHRPGRGGHRRGWGALLPATRPRRRP